MVNKVAAVGKELVDIKSPAEGIFYAEPPESFHLFVELGIRVGPETIIGMVGHKALNKPNDVRAGITGRIVETLVADGDSVDSDQVLFRVEPD